MSIFSSPGSSDSLMVLWAAAALDVGTFDYHPHFMRSLAFECVHVFNLSLKKKLKTVFLFLLTPHWTQRCPRSSPNVSFCVTSVQVTFTQLTNLRPRRKILFSWASVIMTRDWLKCQDKKQFIIERRKISHPKYRNLYNFATINIHELYKFTPVHNLPNKRWLTKFTK